MRTDFSPDRYRWAMRYTSHAAAILDACLPRRARFATEREDRRQATDFVLMTAGDITAALRVRRHWTLAYGDLTFRFELPTGHLTEFAKILDGHGDYMVYGVAAADQTPRLCQWTVVDLAAFRDWCRQWNFAKTKTDHGSSPSGEKNSDRLW
jgi:hypothetical protein